MDGRAKLPDLPPDERRERIIALRPAMASAPGAREDDLLALARKQCRKEERLEQKHQQRVLTDKGIEVLLSCKGWQSFVYADCGKPGATRPLYLYEASFAEQDSKAVIAAIRAYGIAPIKIFNDAQQQRVDIALNESSYQLLSKNLRALSGRII